MAATDLLSRRRPTRTEIADMLSGHLCRCTGYTPIVDAIEACVESARSRGEST
jgi:aerobic-type carbon monoxide dehydrogenase small subunit (CoxS/CutS family)